jgi:hypothetical protein
MGLFGFGKKKYDKNVTRDNEFLKDHAVKCNGLVFYVENNENVKKELNLLKDDFQYAVASTDREAKKIEKKIVADFKTLTATLEQPDFDETEALTLIRGLRRSIVEITSMR